MSRNRSILATVTASILFGFLPLFVSLAYETGLNAYDVAFFRFFLAGIIFSLIVFGKKESFRISKKQAALLIPMAVVGYVLMNTTLFLSYHFLSVAMATTIHFSYPIIVSVLAFLFYRQKLGVYGIAALFLSALGIVLLSLHELTSSSFLGISLSFLSAVFLAVYALGVAHPLLQEMSVFKLLFYISLIAAAVIFIGELACLTTPFARLTPPGFLNVAFLAVVCTVIALSLFTGGIRGLGPAMTCILSTLEPITSIVLGMLFLAQPLYWQMSVGAGLIITAVILVTWPKKEKTAGTEAKVNEIR